MRDDISGQGLKIFALRDEMRLTRPLDPRALSGSDQAVGRGSLTAATGHLRPRLRPKHLNRLVEVAVGFLERLLAVHHAGACCVAQFLDVSGGNPRHYLLVLLLDRAAVDGLVRSWPASRDS